MDDSGKEANSNYSKEDLIAIIYVKCKKDQARKILEELQKIIGSPWIPSSGSKENLTISIIATLAGFFDVAIVAEASSAYIVSEFCMEFLRAESGLGELVLDTQSTIGVIHPLKSDGSK